MMKLDDSACEADLLIVKELDSVLEAAFLMINEELSAFEFVFIIVNELEICSYPTLRTVKLLEIAFELLFWSVTEDDGAAELDF